jgi:flagellar hook-associated protein 3 FlgL
MRISTNQMQFRAVNSILDQQSDMSKTQMQLASGERIVKPSDDPVASAAILGLNQSKAVTERYQLNADAAQARLEIEEGTLTSVTNQLQRVRELALQANNGTNTDSDRVSIAKEVRQILDQLMGLANTTDNNNKYLFAGHQGNTIPFSQDTSGNYIYNGDDGQRFIQVGPTRTIADADAGSDVFMNIRNGNGVFVAQDAPTNTGTGVIDQGSVVDSTLYDHHDYTISFALNAGVLEYTVTDTTVGAPVGVATPYTEGNAINFGRGIETVITGQPAVGDQFTLTPSQNESIFKTIDDLIVAMETPAPTSNGRANLNNAINHALTNVDQALETVLNTRAGIGARLNAIDDQKDNNENFLLQVDESISVLNDLDYAEAISRLNLQLTGLQAAQSTFTKVQSLSLFNYLG